MRDCRLGVFDTPLTVDVGRQTLATPQTPTMHFDIDPFRKVCLLEGVDDIAFTARYENEIAAFVAQYRGARPWLDLARS